MCMEALSTIAKIWDQPVVINEYMNKENVVYMHNEILLSHEKKKEILSFVMTSMNVGNLVLREINRKTNTTYCHLYVKTV